ncbi:unnamed protein product [Vicia faba]|uniref:DNA 3'-5' helicase n=1 Tax=Vicia faba TaxID=3906 RepID=A0AAV1BBY0_VICFA|nr:unnamed protein product [Vicia faba]
MSSCVTILRTSLIFQLRTSLIFQPVLFVSPERFLNKEFLSAISAGSAVSLVVIDEAHCISEWSHNFRPSFMRLRASLLHRSLNVGFVLAMTATATTTTLDAIMSALDIPFTNLIQNAHLRDNLRLSASLIKNRMKDLLVLIKSPPFADVKGIIVYCKFQSETDQISRYLNDNNISAKSYHSGIFAKERGNVQELFASNKIRVVVATVAFGMGLDKRDVGAVIHYSLPGSLEEFVQEYVGATELSTATSLLQQLFVEFQLKWLAEDMDEDEDAADFKIMHDQSHLYFFPRRRVSMDNDSCHDCTLIKIDSVNKPGILLEVVQILTDLDFIITKAYISSDGGWFMDGSYARW